MPRPRCPHICQRQWGVRTRKEKKRKDTRCEPWMASTTSTLVLGLQVRHARAQEQGRDRVVSTWHNTSMSAAHQHPWNMSLLSPDRTTQYRITTSSVSKDNIAAVHEHCYSGVIILGESKPISVHWLKKSIIPFKSYMKCSHSSIAMAVWLIQNSVPQCHKIQRWTWMRLCMAGWCTWTLTAGDWVSCY